MMKSNKVLVPLFGHAAPVPANTHEESERELAQADAPPRTTLGWNELKQAWRDHWEYWKATHN
jgi:hypothetical protein